MHSDPSMKFGCPNVCYRADNKAFKGVHYQNSFFPFFLNYETILLICCYAQSPDKKRCAAAKYCCHGYGDKAPHSEIDTILCAGLLDRH